MTLLVRDITLDPSVCILTETVFEQLRRASDRFSSFVLIRVVRLTIETNFLTGTCLEVRNAEVHLTCC